MNKKAKLLDLGTGPEALFKRSLLVAIEKIQTKDITTIDIDPEFVDEQRNFGFKALVHDVSKPLPFSKNTFDVVLANHIIEHLSDIDLFVFEIQRVLKKDGYAVIGTENLASWHNVFALFLGFQPFSFTNISSIANIGNPLSLHKGDQQWEGMGHNKVLSFQAFVDLFNIHKFKIEKILGAGYYPLPNILARFFTKIDLRHASRLQIKVRKK